MHWNNTAEFLAMGGYALYVWGSFGACALAMLVEPWLIRRQHGSVLKLLREKHRAHAAPVPPARPTE